jgi:hypothetical protein
MRRHKETSALALPIDGETVSLLQRVTSGRLHTDLIAMTKAATTAESVGDLSCKILWRRWLVIMTLAMGNFRLTTSA